MNTILYTVRVRRPAPTEPGAFQSLMRYAPSSVIELEEAYADYEVYRIETNTLLENQLDQSPLVIDYFAQELPK